MQSLKNGSQIDDFVIVRLIAKGGMGEVYEAYEKTLDRKVALKIIKKNVQNATDMIRRFNREARILAKVNHPNIVTVYSIKSSEEFQYLSMELIEGVSFKDFLTEFSLPSQIAISLFTQSLEAVQVVHRLNIIHRDLKPSNILFLKEGEIKILDFGIAQFANSDADQGVVVGSPPYMAPEIADGYRASWQSECWALGAILYELVTRNMIFHRMDKGEVILTEGDLDMIPEFIVKIIEKACAKDPKARYQNSEEFMMDLVAAGKKLPEITESDKLRLQAQVKELLNRARAWVDTRIAVSPAQVVSPAATRVDMTLPNIPSMTGIHDGRVDISASTIMQKKPALPETFVQAPALGAPFIVQKKSSTWTYFAVLALAFLGGGGYYLHDHFPEVALAFSKIKSEKTAEAKAELKPEAKSEVKVEAKVESKVEPKVVEPKTIEPKIIEPKIAEVAKPETTLEPLIPTPEEFIFAEAKHVDFKWNQVLKPKTFKIEIAADPNFSKMVFSQPVAGNGFQWKKLPKAGSYHWRVSPVGKNKEAGIGTQNFSLIDAVAINPELPKLKSEAFVSDNEKSPMEFKWACKQGIDSYQIEIGSSPDFTNAARTTVDKGCSWSTSLGEGDYFWRVKAAKKIKELDFMSKTLSFKVSRKIPIKVAAAPASAPEPELPEPARKPASIKPPVKVAKAKPVSLKAKNLLKLMSPPKGAKAPTRNGQVSIEFSWAAQPSATKYILELSSDPSFGEVIQTLESQESRFLVENISQKGRIYWRVKAEGSASNDGNEWSEASFLEIL